MLAVLCALGLMCLLGNAGWLPQTGLQKGTRCILLQNHPAARPASSQKYPMQLPIKVSKLAAAGEVCCRAWDDCMNTQPRE